MNPAVWLKMWRMVGGRRSVNSLDGTFQRLSQTFTGESRSIRRLSQSSNVAIAVSGLLSDAIWNSVSPLTGRLVFAETIP